MFTPEGYWSFTEVREVVPQWTSDLIIGSQIPRLSDHIVDYDNPKTNTSIQTHLVLDGFAENLDEAQFAIEICELWVLANFMDIFDVVLCSPTGLTLRCPPTLCAHGDAFDWWQWPLSYSKLGEGETSGYLYAHRNGGFKIADAYGRFCAIDYVSGTIRLKPNTVQLLNGCSYGHGPNKESILNFIDEQIRPFVGWSVCWNPKDLPETREGIFESLGFGDIDWTELERSTLRSQGSSSSQQNVLDCVTEAYPNGKGKATWEQVTKRVGYSRRHILRAIAKSKEHKNWAQGGQG